MVKIRLSRHGSKKRPYYRVVVQDSRRSRDGKFIDDVGRFNPCVNPELIELDTKKINKGIQNGAQPTKTVSELITKSNK